MSARLRLRRLARLRSARERPAADAAGPGGGPARRSRRVAGRSVLLLSLLGILLVAPARAATAEPLWWQALTSPDTICSPSDPVPEVAGTGLNGLIDAPGSHPPVTPYNNYEMAGLTWHATDLGCSDYLAIVGNYAANFVFMIVKAIDRLTITAYQTAYSPGLLNDLSDAVTDLVTSLKDTFYLPYVTPVVLLGVLWLAWHGLVRRRATTSVEGVVWMIIAVTAALWFLNRPHDILQAGNGVVTGANCAITKGVAQVDPNTSGQCSAQRDGAPAAVDQTADSLWTVLVYRPWLAGEFGTGRSNPPESAQGVSATLAREYGGTGEHGLLWTQAMTQRDLAQARSNGQYDSEAASTVINEKHTRWEGIKEDIKNNYPSAYPLFQGRQWGARLGIAFAAFIASIFAGGLVLLVSVALIVLKLGFLLLLMTGPFFLLAGIHPGVGRVIALRWAELLVSTLLKQVVVALALAVLLFGYSVITTGSSLSWGLQVLLLSLLGIAAFIYRKPFQHLFASVGGGFGGRVVSESAGTNPELDRAHRRLATAPAGPPAVRRLGGRLATTALGGAVAGAVGGRAGAAAASSAARRRGDRSGAPGDGAGAPDAAATAGETAPGDEGAAGEKATKDGRLAGLRSRPHAGAPPPLDLAARRTREREGHASGWGSASQGSGSDPDPAASAGEPGSRNGDGPPAAGGAPRGARPARGPWSGRGGGSTDPADGGHPRGGHAAGSGGAGGVPWWEAPVRRRAAPPAGSDAPQQPAQAARASPPRPPARSRPESSPEAPPRSHDGAEAGADRPRGDRRGGSPPLWSPGRRPNSAPPLPFWLRRSKGDDSRE